MFIDSFLTGLAVHACEQPSLVLTLMDSFTVLVLELHNTVELCIPCHVGKKLPVVCQQSSGKKVLRAANVCASC